MRHFGLIGYPLSHSFSSNHFKNKFKSEKINADYTNFPLEKISDFTELLNKHDKLDGLNVTIPYKEQIIEYLDLVDDEAKSIGAVNTIKFHNNKLIGYNTDVYGFEESLKPLLEDFHSKALILGTGGAAKAVEYVLNKLEIWSVLVSRNPNGEHQISYNDLSNNILNEYLIIINTTPLGTYPDIGSYPNIDYNVMSKYHLMFDLVYNPSVTKFLEFGEKNGAITKNGLEMLEIQAEKSWEIWNC